MTFYLTLRYPTGHHQTLTFPSACSRALIVITASPYADAIRQWETDEAFVPRVDRDARSVHPPTAASGDAEPLRLSGLPVRLDATLCDVDEMWLENPDGSVVKVL